MTQQVQGEVEPVSTGRSCALHPLYLFKTFTDRTIYSEDELSPELRFTGAGILAMANSGPNTNGSQFFISLGPTPYLDGKHTIFGRVSSGMRVVQRLGAVATDAQDRCVIFVVIGGALGLIGCGIETTDRSKT